MTTWAWATGRRVQRIGVFMAQAGGAFIDDDGTTAVVDSPENAEALQYVKDQMAAGTFSYSSDLGAGWGGEALGNGLAAMVIEGNWIAGAMTNDFPDVNYHRRRAAGGTGRQGHDPVHELLGHGRAVGQHPRRDLTGRVPDDAPSRSSPRPRPSA